MRTRRSKAVPLPGLPAPARARLAASLAAARLPRREGEEVEAELAAHFEDGLESGRSLEDLLEEFGEPASAGALIGRSVRRRRRARRPALSAARFFTLAVALVYGALFARLHLRAPERAVAPSPAARLAVLAPWSSPAAKHWGPGEIRAEFDVLLASMYTAGDEGRLTAAGLRVYQAWKGKLDPGPWAAFLEPAFFPNAASRGEVRRELERFLHLAADPASLAFERERSLLLSSPRRALRFAALEIPLAHLAGVREAARAFRGAPAPEGSAP